MAVSEKQIPISSQPLAEGLGFVAPRNRGLIQRLLADSEFRNVIATFMTTLSVFGIYLLQGVVVARILGVVGRGEFGTAMFFPRDVFLYAGLLGGIEIVNSYAVNGNMDSRSLKYSAAKVGFISCVITAVVAAVIAVAVLVCVGKTYLIPFCLLCCLFVPWEHMQLTISAVDRGSKNFFFYNINRLLFAASFLVLLLIVFGLGIDSLTSLSSLTVVCILFVLARVVGILPTLRGMDVLGTLGGKAKGNAQSIKSSQITDDGNPFSTLQSASLEETHDGEYVEGSKDSVPGPWELLKQGRFYALSMLASEMFERLDMFLIVAIASVAESGFYFVAVPAAQMLTIAPNALQVFTFNAGADKENKVSLNKAMTVLSATALLQTVSALLFALILPLLIITLYTEEFSPAITFAMWLLPACAIKGYLQAADGFLKGRDKPLIGVWARFLSIFVMLTFVGLVYAEVIEFEQKLISIPMAACLGQAISMVIITIAVIKDVMANRPDDFDANVEVSNVHV